MSNLTLEQVRDERLRALREYIALLEEKERELVSGPQSELADTGPSDVVDARYAKLPLGDAIPLYLGACNEPQTARQIVSALKAAGREFESDNPVHSVRTVIKNLMVTNDDVFHVGWAKYHLKSRYKRNKTKLGKLLAESKRFAGTGGRTTKEHAKRTADGIAKRRSEGLRWGPAIKATPELIERAKQMMRDGVSLTETCRTLNVAIPTLYQHGIRQRALKKEGAQSRELPLEDHTEGDNVVRFAKGKKE